MDVIYGKRGKVQAICTAEVVVWTSGSLSVPAEACVSIATSGRAWGHFLPVSPKIHMDAVLFLVPHQLVAAMIVFITALLVVAVSSGILRIYPVPSFLEEPQVSV